MTDLFISYSRKDQQFVRKLHAVIEEGGRDAWVDWENIPLTAEWLQEIYEGIEASNAFIYIISPDSVRSEVCSLELAHAIAHNKRLIPVLRRELVEDADKYALDSHISSHNWIFFREQDDFDKSVQALTEALDTDLDYLRVHTRLLVRSMEWNDKERDASLVLRGRDLVEALQWLEKTVDKDPQPTELHRDYIAASQRAAAARRRVVALTAVYGLVVFVLAVFAFWQAVTAETRRQEAEEQKEIAQDNAATATIAQGEAQIQAATAIAAQSTAVFNGEQAQSLALAGSSREVLYRDTNAPLAIALALASVDTEQPSPLAQSSLAQAAYFPGTRHVIEGTSANFPTPRLAADATGKFALGVSADNQLVMWSLDTFAIVHGFSEAKEALISSVAFSPDGQQVVVGYEDGALLAYDATTYEKQWEITLGNGGLPRLVYTPDNQSLVTSFCDNECSQYFVGVLNAANGETIRTFDKHLTNVFAIAISPDGQQALTGDDDGAVYVWNITTGAEIGTFNLEAGQVAAAAFMPSGQQALIGYGDFSLRLVDFTDFAALQQIYQLQGHTNIIWDLAITANGKQAVSGSYDNSLILWNLETGDTVQRFRGHGNLIYSVALVGQRRMLSGSLDGTIRLWDIVSGAEQNRFEGHVGTVQAVITYQTADNETRLISAARDGVIIIWDAATGTEIQRLESDAGAVWGLDVHVEKGLLISAHRIRATDGRVLLWDLNTGQEIRRFDNGVGFLTVSFNSDASIAAIAGEPGEEASPILLWDTATGAVLRELVGHESRVWSVQFSPDNQQLASADVDSHVWLWDVASGVVEHELVGHDGVIYTVAYNADGTQLLSGSGDRTLRLWDAATGDILQIVAGHQDEVKKVAFDATGTIALSGSDDRSVRLWNLETGAEIQRFEGHTSDVWTIAYHPDGKSIFSGSADTTVRHWQVLSLEELLIWTRANRYIPILSDVQCELYQLEDWCRTVNNS
jgi:WD40 repeat protein